ncbi:MAG: NADH-quinone oxidoreductase subunit J [Chloroflexota bacterium]|nr:NADH-quinone oxidoreductase subunit J [Dehalococcoidia bacterium]MDW8254865.1 NADH-quinone oxidoreductase subunit J [Chloroflexota bacterium]
MTTDGVLVAFGIVAAVAIVASLGVVLARNVVHAAVSLIVSLMAVAGVYVLLLADFLALAQVLIYGGAVTILLLFALMLYRTGRDPGLDNRQRPLAAVAALAVAAFLGWAIVATGWPAIPDAGLQRIDLPVLGTALFTTWALPFEVVSLVLLVALIGAAILSRSGDAP